MQFLLLCIPVSLLLEYVVHAQPLWVFVTAILGIIPLADWMRRATEEIGYRLSPALGGLLNVTFGNAAELILALFVLMAGKQSVAKAQITGSIIGNGLLGLGMAIFVGCWGKEKLVFKRERAGLVASLLVLSVIALLIPALFDMAERSRVPPETATILNENLSLGVSVVLIFLYGANLLYTLRTHQCVFALADDETKTHAWPLVKSLLILVGATCLTAWEAELVSGALESTADKLGLTPFFLGIVVLAVVGNAAEYFAAIYFARQGKMGMVISITIGATVQVALLVAPLLVLVSFLLGHPMDLVFSNPLELIAVAAVAFAVNAIAQDGEVTWFEGLVLLGVYALLALAFFFLSPH
jgi:Ca2+:H+ antiporter